MLIVECKADVKDHESIFVENFLNGLSFFEDDDSKVKRTQRFAIDGALHYAKALSKKFNVIAIGVSGETKKSALVSTYLWPKGGIKPKELFAKDGAALNKFIPWTDYIEHATFDPSVQKLRSLGLRHQVKVLNCRWPGKKRSDNRAPVGKGW